MILRKILVTLFLCLAPASVDLIMKTTTPRERRKIKVSLIILAIFSGQGEQVKSAVLE